jgi:DHA2 family multidrug resistance protein-like MFS transporter
LFRVPAFSTSVAINLLVGIVMAGTFLLVAQYLQLVLGIGPFEAGLWLLPQTAAIIMASMLSTVVVRRVPAAYLVSAGLAVASLGLVILSRVDADAGLPAIVIGSVILGIGVAPASTLSTDLIIGSAPPERAGAASAISETGGELGNALGIAVLGSIGVAVYRNAMADGVAAGADDVARETLSGAVSAAQQLPAGPAAELLANARDAFAAGLQLSAVLGAGATVLAAVAAAMILRRPTSTAATR